MALLRLDSVSKQYTSQGTAVVALHEVSMELRSGQFAALVGRSGCGKTTLLNLAGAMDFPTSGRVVLDGTCTSELSESQLTELRRQQVGFIFQFFQLLPTMTALENVELPALLAGRPKGRSRARELLAWVEMENLGDRYPHQLSGGQMQRVAIARALVNSPRLVLADEPIGNLDTTTGDLVLDLLRRTAKEFGSLVLMATHSRESAEKCDVIVRMRDGHVEEVIRQEMAIT